MPARTQMFPAVLAVHVPGGREEGADATERAEIGLQVRRTRAHLRSGWPPGHAIADRWLNLPSTQRAVLGGTHPLPAWA